MYRRKSKLTKKFISSFLIASMLFSLAGCGRKAKTSNSSTSLTGDITATTVKGKNASDEFIQGTTAFSIDLFKSNFNANYSGTNNILIAPESVSTALALAANGSDGTTKDELYNVLCKGISQDDYNAYMYTYNNRLNSSEDVTFNLANSIWLKKGLPVDKNFLQTNLSYYDSETHEVEFNQADVDQVNGWVNEKTNHMIPEVIKEFSADTVMLLVNAIAFEGEWETPYDESQVKENYDFTNSQGNIEKVNMLCSDEAIYIEDNTTTGVIKYYKGGQFAFMALLPNEDIDLSDYVNSLSADKYMNLYNNRSYEDVVTKIPEFSYDYFTLLNDDIAVLGAPTAFEESNANFYPMTDTDEQLYINRIIHKTHIKLDKNGTKAAATTAIEIKCESAAPDEEYIPPKYVTLDRPFVYAIIDTETGLPIFIGTVSSIN